MEPALAERTGPIVALQVLPADGSAFQIERLLVERTLSVNTAAGGGNASCDDRLSGRCGHLPAPVSGGSG